MNKEKIDEIVNAEDGQMGIIFNIPKNTYRLEVIAKVVDDDGEMHEMSTFMTLPEIIDARILGDEWEAEHAKYCLTKKAKQEIAEKGMKQFCAELAEELKKGKTR